MHYKDWNYCRQATWKTGEIVELYELRNGKHKIKVVAMGCDFSFEVPSYAGFIQYDKWVDEVNHFLEAHNE